MIATPRVNNRVQYGIFLVGDAVPYVAKLAGQRFGRLTVIERSGTHKFGFALWRCQCDCGAETIVPTGALKSGHTGSCGCGRWDGKRLPQTDWVANQIHYKYREVSAQKGRDFLLTREEFRTLIDSPCYYCGRAQTKIVRRRNPSGNTYEYACNGVDRFDNSQGYTVQNSVSCCEDCNRAKLTMPAEQYIALCRAVAEHHPITSLSQQQAG